MPSSKPAIFLSYHSNGVITMNDERWIILTDEGREKLNEAVVGIIRDKNLHRVRE